MPGGPTLEILPKIDHEDGAVRAALVRMLAVAWGLRVTDGELASMDTQRCDLLEILIRLFIARLLTIVRRGLPRRYREHQEDLKQLRGRLNVTRQVTRFVGRPDQIACRFEEWSEDTPLNRVLKAAVSRLAGLTRSADTSRRLAELAARLEFVGDTADPLREQVRLDRTNTAFHDIYRQACRFLAREWQDTTTGAAQGFALLFPMNELFEEFVGRSVRAASPGPSISNTGGIMRSTPRARCSPCGPTSPWRRRTAGSFSIRSGSGSRSATTSWVSPHPTSTRWRSTATPIAPNGWF